MARTKQTARKHLESPKKASAVKKSPTKKNAGKKVLRYVIPTICTLLLCPYYRSQAQRSEIESLKISVEGDSECPRSA